MITPMTDFDRASYADHLAALADEAPDAPAWLAVARVATTRGALWRHAAAIRERFRQRTPLFTGLQHIAEFWNVSTRPPGERGGFNLPLDEVTRRLSRIRRGVKVIAETPLTPEIWLNLVRKHGVRGVQVHDARTVALMLTHSLTRLLTLNKSDFARYGSEGLQAITPAELAAVRS